MQNGFGGGVADHTEHGLHCQGPRVGVLKEATVFLLTVVGSSKVECDHVYMWLFTITTIAEAHAIAGICSFCEPARRENPVVNSVVAHFIDPPMDAPCRVVNGRGLYVETAYSGLRSLADDLRHGS